MSTVKAVVFGAFLMCAGCVPAPDTEQEDAWPDTGGAAATIRASGEPGNCRFTWDGEAVAPDGLLMRAVATIEDAIDAHGGAANMVESDLPSFAFQASGDGPYHCTSIALGTMRSAGFYGFQFALPGGLRGQQVYLDVPGMELDAPRVVVALGDDDELALSGRAMTLDELAQEVPLTTVSEAEGFYVMPSDGTSTDRVHEVIETIRSGGAMVTLASCFAEAFDTPIGVESLGDPLPRC